MKESEYLYNLLNPDFFDGELARCNDTQEIYDLCDKYDKADKLRTYIKSKQTKYAMPDDQADGTPIQIELTPAQFEIAKNSEILSELPSYYAQLFRMYIGIRDGKIKPQEIPTDFLILLQLVYPHVFENT